MINDDKLTFSVGGVNFTMIKVEGGTFTMGATSEQGSDVYDNEYPAHQVTLSTYYMGETVVTQSLWEAVMGTTVCQQRVKSGGSASTHKGIGYDYPMYYVNWEECQDFISKLNDILSSQLGGKKFTLPTEAQWEYAARGGNKSRGYKYSGSDDLSKVGWYNDNSGRSTRPVASKRRNDLCLYDMSGNVYEWCADWYGDYSNLPQTDPQGPESGEDHICRGGGWNDGAWGCRVSYRNYDAPSSCFSDLGFRLCLIP